MAGLSPAVPGTEPSFIQGDRALADKVVRPIARFLQIEIAGGVLLLAATVVALVWANSPWQASYESFWHTAVAIQIGPFQLEEDLGHIVNDVLMTLFFLVVGLEIKHEMVSGELKDRRSIALPAIAAFGGMAVPALVYVGFNVGGPGIAGWGIPMATDIAFALGVLALLGSRIPAALKVFLLTLAIVDDIGAITVIAVFYTSDLRLLYLLAAAALAALVYLLGRWRVVYPPVYIGAGILLWLAVYESGVHATIAGVAIGLLLPAQPFQSDLDAQTVIDHLEARGDLTVEEVRASARAIAQSVSIGDRLIDALHPWTSYVIVPIFALANAGIALTGAAITDPSAVTLGVAFGLVVGKLVGITAFAWLTVRLRIATLPSGASWLHISGVATLAGIGFTVSLFITDLAFATEALQADAKTGILVASAAAAIMGSVILLRAPSRSRPSPAPRARQVTRPGVGAAARADG
jgi:NhaA family Na+:H+ antiporter